MGRPGAVRGGLLLLGLCLLGVAPAGDAGGPEPDAEPTFAERWKEAVAAHPALREFRPLDLEPLPLAALRAWAPPGKPATFYDDECRPVKLEGSEEGLHGTARESVYVTGKTKRVQGTGIGYGVEVSELGSGWTDYERGEDGRWREAGAGGVGDLHVRTGVLAAVGRDVARWTGAIVRLSAICDGYREDVSVCGQGERICSACRSVAFEVQSMTAGVGFGRAPGTVLRRNVEPERCEQPCPPDPNGPVIERLDRLLAGREFLAPNAVPDGPRLYRSLAACRKARGKKPQ